jgi:hypothetical protein
MSPSSEVATEGELEHGELGNHATDFRSREEVNRSAGLLSGCDTPCVWCSV